MAGTVYDDLKDKKTELIRKALDGSAFLAPISSTAISTLTDPADKLLVALPAGYEDLGYVSTDGFSFGREVEEAQIRAHGATDPVRSDITADSSTLTVQCLETKLNTIGLYTGANMAGVLADFDTGEVVIDKPSRPRGQYYRLLKISVDLGDDGEIYIARFFPRAKVTNFDEQTFTSDGENPITWPVTLTAFTDSTLGFSERWLFGGPGWDAILTDMGFSRAPDPTP
ncbi:hypothetical protein [Allonocardiopsis opalescens]|uniref:Major tail protein n=1 Tax=Allonocardiopsis opalescens TaxID=1144618 RepID=A0A2T0PVM0_9ACTN|nr:hypothetical protein [Allonocardiopsis opalescens]PRX95571.1 hypothetical protein CLV72_109180 [Allonocardiopsis opalescens]